VSRQRTGPTVHLLGFILLYAAVSAVAQPILDHPGKLIFGELVFSPPSPESLRVDLGDGLVVYLLQDPTLPVFDLSASWPGGSYDDPPGFEGLRSMTGSMLRLGGTKSMSADALDERLEYLSAGIGTSAGLFTSGASCSCLSRDADEVMGLMKDVLFSPGFDEARFRIMRDQRMEGLRRRFDSVDQVLGTMRPRLMYGDAPFAQIDTGASIEAISTEHLIACHREDWVPRNVTVMVSGRFDRDAVLQSIREVFAGRGPEVRKRPPREERTEMPGAVEPGVYVLDKKMPQASVEVSHLGIERHHPDYLVLQVMNRILGGGGFSSRIVRRVRSDEGLAYGVGSFVSAPVGYTGRLGASLQCAAKNCAYAVSLIVDEFQRIRREPVTDRELAEAKAAYLESFPAMFDTSNAVVQRLGGLEIDQLPMDYYSTLRQRISEITVEDVQRAAGTHIRPEALRILISADADIVQAGNPAYPVALSDLGKVQVIVPQDPLMGR